MRYIAIAAAVPAVPHHKLRDAALPVAAIVLCLAGLAIAGGLRISYALSVVTSI